MFNNIGGKIKGLASVITMIGVIVSIVIAVILFVNEAPLIGFAVGIFGSLLSWVGSLVLYGFGQLVQNSDVLAGHMTLEEAEESIGKKVEKYTSEVAEESEREQASIESRLAMLEKRYASGAISRETYQSEYAEILKEADWHEEE